MKNRGEASALVTVLVLAVVITGGLFGWAKPAAGKAIQLSYATYMPEAGDSSLVFKDFAKKVTERTKGQLVFRYFWAGALGGPTEILDLTSKGSADIGLISVGYYPGVFPLTRIGDLQFVTSKVDAKQKAYMRLLKEFPAMEKEFSGKNVKLIIPVSGGDDCVASKKRVEKVEDWKGLKVGTLGYDTDIMRLWGATPVGMAAGEYYDSMKRGVIDACAYAPFAPLVSFSLQEVAKYFIDPGIGSMSVMPTFMNLKSYNNLPPDIRKIFDEEIEIAVSETVAQVRQAAIRMQMPKIIPAGCEAYTLSDAVKAQLRNMAAEKIFALWLSDADKAGVGAVARQMLVRFQELYKQYEPQSTFKDFVQVYQTEFKK